MIDPNQHTTGQDIQADQFARALAAADRLREATRTWQTVPTDEAEDVVETLRLLWEERDDEL